MCSSKHLFLKDGPQYKYDNIASAGIVIDVGINRTEDGKLVGDCDIEEMTKGPWSESCIRYYTPCSWWCWSDDYCLSYGEHS